MIEFSIVGLVSADKNAFQIRSSKPCYCTLYSPSLMLLLYFPMGKLSMDNINNTKQLRPNKLYAYKRSQPVENITVWKLLTL